MQKFFNKFRSQQSINDETNIKIDRFNRKIAITIDKLELEAKKSDRNYQLYLNKASEATKLGQAGAATNYLQQSQQAQTTLHNINVIISRYRNFQTEATYAQLGQHLLSTVEEFTNLLSDVNDNVNISKSNKLLDKMEAALKVSDENKTQLDTVFDRAMNNNKDKNQLDINQTRQNIELKSNEIILQQLAAIPKPAKAVVVSTNKIKVEASIGTTANTMSNNSDNNNSNNNTYTTNNSNNNTFDINAISDKINNLLSSIDEI